MNLLILSYDAVKLLAQIHQFQSSEYPATTDLYEALSGEKQEWQSNGIKFIIKDKTGFFFTSKPEIKKLLVFDLQNFSGFKSNKLDRTITIFQKIIKYSVRHFEKLPPAACEKIIKDSTTSIVFPFPFVATVNAYRVLIDRVANERLKKRDLNCLFVYKDGNETELTTPNYTNFNKAIDFAKEIPSHLMEITEKGKVIADASISAFQLTQLTPMGSSLQTNIGYDNWLSYLTSTQADFINRDVNGPERLEGAAGTGKTLSMILRCIGIIKKNIAQNSPFNLLFITHSIATKNQIVDSFRANFDQFDNLKRFESPVSITVTTLQEWCIDFLGEKITDTEYLDKDAQDSKILQKYYLEDAFNKKIKDDFNSFKPFCSQEFISFIEATKDDDIVEMLLHEVSVVIKGRAGEDIEKYKVLPRIKYSIPCKCDGDLNFIFSIYSEYQRSLQIVNQFDSDDIILTALGQLNTPIWRRRRENEGFDASFIDETHLFNLNELSIFHYLNKSRYTKNIVFTIDQSQAIGDRGLVDEVLFDALGLDNVTSDSSSKFNTIFRSSPDIINLAFNILSSGATLFTNFANPLDNISFNFTESEEKLTRPPLYILEANDDAITDRAFREAEILVKDLKISRANILLISTSEHLLDRLIVLAKKQNKPIEVIKSRGDMEIVKSATKSNRFVLAGMDYVGGLEFDAVIIIGVDKGRVPPQNSESVESSHFLNYSWHNRMYVAITRAKYSLILIGDKSRGEPKILESSLSSEILRKPQGKL